MTVVRTANEQRAGRRFLLIIGFLLIAANMRAALTSVGPLLETIRREVGLSAGEAGFIGTLPLLTFAAISPQVPRLARRWGTDLMLWSAMAALSCSAPRSRSPTFLALAFFSLRAADPRSSASLGGMGQSIGYLFAAVGPVAVGGLHDATGGWKAPLAVLAVLAAAHAVVGLRAGRDAHVRV